MELVLTELIIVHSSWFFALIDNLKVIQHKASFSLHFTKRGSLSTRPAILKDLHKGILFTLWQGHGQLQALMSILSKSLLIVILSYLQLFVFMYFDASHMR